jgi:hypothetical protein
LKHIQRHDYNDAGSENINTHVMTGSTSSDLPTDKIMYAQEVKVVSENEVDEVTAETTKYSTW